MTIDEMESLVTKMRELGVKELRSGDIHIVLGAEPIKYIDESLAAMKDKDDEEPFTEEQMYMHSGAIPILRGKSES